MDSETSMPEPEPYKTIEECLDALQAKSQDSPVETEKLKTIFPIFQDLVRESFRKKGEGDESFAWRLGVVERTRRMRLRSSLRKWPK
jgi:hypothetical protein